VHGADTLPASALAVRQATRMLDGRRVLDGVSFNLAPGRIAALAGANGAGKSSLLRAIAGRLRLDDGSIVIDGVTPMEARRSGRLGVVPQEVALYAHLTVRENLSVLGRLAGLRGTTLRMRVDEGLEWSGLTDRATSLVRTLSGGMRRRVNLVAGVLHRPALLLLDEPTVGVDADSEARLHALLRALRDAGMAVLVATHDLDEAAVLCDDLVVLASGRVRAAGPLAELVASAFAEGRQLMVSVDAGGVDSAADALALEGFRRTGAHTWVRAATGSLSDLEATERRLVAAGVRVAEARLAEPSVRGALAVLLGSPGMEQP
jgi:ABC-2 type transport system ATP-binding protein